MSRKSNKPTQTNDTSNIVSISDLSENARENMFKTEIVRLESHNVGLGQTIDNLLKSLDNKDVEIAHLKSILVGASPIISTGSLIASDEEAIIDIQIRKLKESTQNREMTLDETKRLDLLIKNKRLIAADIKPKNTDELPRDVTPQDLLTIASTRIKRD